MLKGNANVPYNMFIYSVPNGAREAESVYVSRQIRLHVSCLLP